MCCGGQTSSGSSNSSGNSTIDPDLKAAVLNWYDNQKKIQGAGQGAALGPDGQFKPYQAYDDPRIAGMTDAQKQAISDQTAHGNDSRGLIQQGRDVAASTAGFNPTNATASTYDPSGYNSTGYSSRDAAATGYSSRDANLTGYDATGYDAAKYAANQQGSAAQTGGAATVGNAATIAGSNLNQYINPFRSQVTDATLADLDRARKMSLNDGGSTAAAANAFGGSRHGVADSLTNDAFARASASTLAGLNKDAFTTALGAAGQDATNVNDVRKFDSGQINDVNKFDTSNRQQTQNLNQAADNEARMFGATADNTALAAKMAADNRAREFNVSEFNRGELSNAAADNAARSFNVSEANRTALANAAADNAARGFNAGADNTAKAFTAGANNDAGAFNAGAKNTNSMFNSNLGLQGAQLRSTMASILGNLGTQLQNNTNSNNTSLMDLGSVDQGTNQKQLDFNYLNKYLNPNYNDPQFKMGLLNASQGNAPQLASNSSQSGGSSSCGC